MHVSAKKREHVIHTVSKKVDFVWWDNLPGNRLVCPAIGLITGVRQSWKREKRANVWVIWLS